MGEPKLTYSDKLKSPLWQRKRLQVYERDNWTCQLCSDDSTELHVHHISYEPGRQPWEYELDNFTTLCKHCHGAVSIYQKDYPGEFIKAIKRPVPLLKYFAIMLLVKDRNQLKVAVLTVFEKEINLISILSQEAINDINTLMGIEVDNLKTMEPNG